MTAELAQCGTCKAFTLLDQGGPYAVAVDITPLDGTTYAAAIIGGVGLHWVETLPRGGYRRLPRPPGGTGPSFDATGAQSGAQRLHAEHQHPARRSRPVKATQGPPPASATSGAPRDGNRPQAARADAAPGPGRPSHATPATPRPTDLYPRCGTCQRYIRQGEPFWGIQHGHNWISAEHEECP